MSQQPINTGIASSMMAQEAQCVRGATAQQIAEQRPGQAIDLGTTVASGAQAEVENVEGVIKQVYETPYGGSSTRTIPLGNVVVGGTTVLGGPASAMPASAGLQVQSTVSADVQAARMGTQAGATGVTMGGAAGVQQGSRTAGIQQTGVGETKTTGTRTGQF